MNILPLRKKRSITVALAVVCAALAVVGIRYGAVSRAEQNQTKIRTDRHRMERAQLLNGLGREVHFAKRGDSYGTVMASIKSASRFIDERSGVRLGASVEERLAGMEHSILKGESRRVSLDEFTEVLTDTALERVSAATDEELDLAAQSFRAGTNEDVTLRADGRGQMSSEEFASQARAMRNLSRQGDGMVRETVRSLVAKEVTDRVKTLTEGLPEGFRDVQSKGISPSQAVLITYSVSSNDNLGGSSKRLQALTQRESKTQREGKGLKTAKGQEMRSAAAKPFGANGAFFSTPLDLVLDDKTMHGLLDRVERRTKQ